MVIGVLAMKAAFDKGGFFIQSAYSDGNAKLLRAFGQA